jgi:hypothetical protein
MTCLLLSGLLLQAQTYYAVKVADAGTEVPVAHAAVQIESTGKILLTDTSGLVVIRASADDSLLITAKGYVNREIKLYRQAAAILILLEPLAKKHVPAPRAKKHH